MIRADKTKNEECDCENRTQHNNGGNYHYSEYHVALDYIDVFNIDISR